MAVDLLALNEDLPVVSHLCVHPVTTRVMVDHWTRVWGCGAPEEVIWQWFAVDCSLPFGPDRALRLFPGILDGVPVATSSLFWAAWVVSINRVVTVPAFRRQGIRMAVTIHALRA